MVVLQGAREFAAGQGFHALVEVLLDSQIRETCECEGGKLAAILGGLRLAMA